MNGLAAREIDGLKVILPLWHDVDRDDVLAYSPTLADKVALTTAKMSIKKLAGSLAKVLSGSHSFWRGSLPPDGEAQQLRASEAGEVASQLLRPAMLECCSPPPREFDRSMVVA